MNNDDFYRPVVEAAKRLGLHHCHTMGDWFVGFSPRNDSNNAEGHWAHWVNLAAYILSHPATKVVAPENYRTDLTFDKDMYYGGKVLSYEHIADFFEAKK